MTGEVIHLEAYRSAIFRGSRDRPVWQRSDIEMCERQHQLPTVRRVIDRIAAHARADRDWHDEAVRAAYAAMAEGLDQ